MGPELGLYGISAQVSYTVSEFVMCSGEVPEASQTTVHADAVPTVFHVKPASFSNEEACTNPIVGIQEFDWPTATVDIAEERRANSTVFKRCDWGIKRVVQ